MTIVKIDFALQTSRAVVMSKSERLFVDKTDELLTLTLFGKNIEKMDLFGKADTFLEASVSHTRFCALFVVYAFLLSEQAVYLSLRSTLHCCGVLCFLHRFAGSLV